MHLKATQRDEGHHLLRDHDQHQGTSSTSRLHRRQSSSTSCRSGRRATDPSIPGAGDDDDGEAVDLADMDPHARRPGYHRPSDGRSGTPLLYKSDDQERGRTLSHDYDEDEDGPVMFDGGAEGNGHLHSLGPPRPMLSRRSTMRSRSPKEVAAEHNTRTKYIYASIFLSISLVSFCVQTELTAYIQHDLGWNKPYCMMYYTHGSWVALWPIMLLVQRMQKRDVPWSVFWRRHTQYLRATAVMVETRSLDVSRQHHARPVWYMIRYTAIITIALTPAGLSWYIAVSLTTPSDLTALYNCSAFFAYVFSVPLLKEPLRLDKSVAVLIAIAGVLIVAYGDTKSSDSDDTTTSGRFLGNIVIGMGSVLYGLYEVIYKRFACPPEGVSPARGTTFAITFGSLIGIFTLTVLWIPLPILHVLNIERFEVPDASTTGLILVAVLSNAIFSGSFLVLISLTSPVLSSVAALLTIFLVAIVDWLIHGEPLSGAAIVGGSMIIVAFVGLSWSTYREMREHEAKKLAVDFSESDDEGDLRDD